ncbi:flagellar hook-associated protein FlgL [Candidatus Odyssella thessalonicensis]|uniref:flagellar hook-associated protein FlgL n=1 Tax=Candidatus Odyssella thessalonicensis TaxID=84647 RepID=UPI000225B70B|nr:flagellar hook-associated protein FlgL [Candidatus Odyssella thessalonicensis]
MTNLPYLTTARYNQMIALSSERSVQTSSAELTSGGVSGSYGEARNVQQFIGQELILESVQSYKDGAVLNHERLKFVRDQMDKMRETAVELQTRISLLRSSTLASTQELSIWCNDRLGYLNSILNSRFDEKYIFAGTATNVAPTVDLATLPAMALSDPVDATLYYQGSSSDLSFRADDDTVIQTPVRADDIGIAELIFSLRLCSTLPTTEKDDRLQRANDLCLQGHENIVQATNRLENSQKTLERVEESLLNLEQEVSENIKELGYRTDSEVLQDYVESKTRLQLTRYVTTSSLNSIKELIEKIPV